MNFGRLGLLIIKGFENLEEIKHYRKVMAADARLQLPPQVRPVVISAANFNTLLQNGRSFDDYFRFMRDKTYRDTEEAVLPPELFGPSEGLDEEETAEETGPLAETPPEEIPQADAPQPDTSGDTPAATPDAQPGPTTQAAPATQAAPKTDPGTTQTTESKPETESQPETEPKPANKPQLPEYEPGSEGDDPLLD